jgi:hypothetical protein
LGGSALVGDLGAECSDIRNLPRLGHLPVTKVGDHGLIDPEAASGSLDTSEARRHRPRHNHTSHLDLALDDDLLHVVAEIWHSGERVPPHRFLMVDRGGRKTERRVDDYVAMKQFVERVQIAGITGSQPATQLNGRSTALQSAACAVAMSAAAISQKRVACRHDTGGSYANPPGLIDRLAA